MARRFDGTDDIIKRGTVMSTATTNFTMTCWLKELVAVSRYAFLNGNRDAGGGDGYSLRTNTTGTKLAFDIEFVANVTSSTTIVLGRWYHLVGTRDATTWRLYVNGVSEGTPITNAPNTPSFNTTIGGASKSGGSDNTFFNGAVAECAYWTRVLKPQEITALAKGYSPAFFTKNLVDYLPLIGQTTKENDRTTGPKWTVTGAIAYPHPRIIYPRNFSK